MKKNIKRKLSKLLLYFAIVLFYIDGRINASEGNLAGVVWAIFVLIILLMILQSTNDESTREGV
ncbi:hypothetical protein PCV68_001030 [Staphylococcus pseudintermedius]|nr:hypothetical protein [Staphylococcus pseudintermedius]